MKTPVAPTLSVSLLACVLSACGPATKPLQNQAPLAILACDETAEVGVPFTVDGTGSTDLDGEIASHKLLLDPLAQPVDALEGEVTPTRPGVLTVVLTLTDDLGATADARCRVVVGGPLVDDPLDPAEPVDPDAPTDPTDETDPTEPDPSDPSDPRWGSAAASARAYSIDCLFGWPTDWNDGSDVAEDILGMAVWACGHEELHAAEATSTAFLHGSVDGGLLSGFPGMEDAPLRSTELMVVYATRLIPPEGADAVSVSVSGAGVVGVFARDFTVCEDGDDTDFCPVAVADSEWSNDILRDTRVGPQATFDIEGPMDLEVRVGNREGPATWDIDVQFFSDGVLLEDNGRFEAR